MKKQPLPKPFESGRVCCMCGKESLGAIEAKRLDGRGVVVFCLVCWIGES